MRKTILLISTTPDCGETFRNLLNEYTVEEVRLHNGSFIVDSAVSRDIFLIVVCEDCKNELPKLNVREFPECIPMLVIGESSRLPQSIAPASTRLTDYLIFPSSPQILEAKVKFLHQIFTMCHDRELQAVTHHSFLDNIIKRDGLTGLYNRGHLNKKLIEELNRARKHETELTLLILDLDYFNHINKFYGQSFGDSVLNELSSRITKATNPKDISCRFSGSSFAILMPDTALEPAVVKAEKLRQICCKTPIRRGSIKKEISLSIGIASFCSHQPTSEDEFITMAETALFRAKAEGRNRINVYVPVERGDGYSSFKNTESLRISLDRILDKTRSSAISSLQLLTKDLGGTDHRDHTVKVTHLLQLIGQQVGLSDSIIRTFENVSIIITCIRFLFHNDIISRPERFSERERRLLKDLPYKAAEITEIFDFFSMERSILVSQGEKFDGSGFPEGLQGDEIPLGARLFNLVDSFTAMVSKRPHRNNIAPQAILRELVDQAGKQFDPALVHKLLVITEQHALLDLPTTHFAEARSLLEQRFPRLCA